MHPCALSNWRLFQTAVQFLAILAIVAIVPVPALAQYPVGGGLGYRPIGLEAMMGGLPYPPVGPGAPGMPGFPGGVMTGPIGGIGPRLPTYRGRTAMPPGRIARPGTTAETWPWPPRGNAIPRPAAAAKVVHRALRTPTPTVRRVNRPSSSARRETTSSFPVGSTVVGSTTVHRPGSAGANFEGWHRGKAGVSMLGHDRPPHRENREYGFTGW